jgi:hypothetical protein
MLNFVTLFDKNYLSRALALYYSLIKHNNDFVLFIIAMDAETNSFFMTQKYPKIRIIHLDQLETTYAELGLIRQERTWTEFCWTLSAYSIQYVIKKYNLDFCTYIDADIFFYNDPKILINEAGENSVIITEHRYTPEYDQTKTSGKYCVQFMYFRNDTNGQNILEWWRLQCKECCIGSPKNGKFGDQKYLDDWTSRFNKVYVSTNIGCGVAPWNIQQYDLTIENNILFVQDKITKIKKPVIFYHFHGIKKCYEIFNKSTWLLARTYKIDVDVQEKIYKPYIMKLLQIEKETNFISPIDPGHKVKNIDFFKIVKCLLSDIKRDINIYKKYKYYKDKLCGEQILEITEKATILLDNTSKNS